MHRNRQPCPGAQCRWNNLGLRKDCCCGVGETVGLEGRPTVPMSGEGFPKLLIMMAQQAVKERGAAEHQQVKQSTMLSGVREDLTAFPLDRGRPYVV